VPKITHYVCAIVIEYESGLLDGRVIHRGDKGSCEATADLVPAVAVSGSERAKRACVIVVPAVEWEEMQDVG